MGTFAQSLKLWYIIGGQKDPGNPPPPQVVPAPAARTAAGRITSHAGPIITRRAPPRQGGKKGSPMKIYAEMTAQKAYQTMSDAERVELIQKAVTKAAGRTAARIENPEKIWKMMTDDREDIEQAAFLRLLTMLDAGKTAGRDGEELNIFQLAARVANAAISKAWRDLYAHPTAAAEVEDEDGKTFSVIDVDADPTVRRPEDPEVAALQRETLRAVIAAMPAAYQGDAEDVLKMSITHGYTAREIAEFIGCSERRIKRIKEAAQEAAAAIRARGIC